MNFHHHGAKYWPVSRWLKKDVDLQYLIHKSPQILYTVHMEVSWNGGTPQIIHFNGIFHYKQSISGYPHLWKPPYIDSISHGIYLDASWCIHMWHISVHLGAHMWLFPHFPATTSGIKTYQAPCLDITWEVEITHEVGWMAWIRSSGMRWNELVRGMRTWPSQKLMIKPQIMNDVNKPIIGWASNMINFTAKIWLTI